MRVISIANASSLPFQGATYEPGPDGVFDFPESVGVELTTKHASMWVAEAVHQAAVTAAQIDSLRNPNFMVTTVADLLGRVAALEAKHAAASPPETPEAVTPPEGDGEQVPAETAPPLAETTPATPEEPKLTAAQKRAATKKAAASKAPAEPDPGAGGE